MIEVLKKQQIEFAQNVHLKNYCTIKCDLVASLLVLPKNLKELKAVVKICKQFDKKFFVIGNGSNLLFLKDSFVFIKLQGFKKIKKQNNSLICQSCATLCEICQKARGNGLGGIEGLFGIPAQIGGATCMNARAFGCELKDVIMRVRSVNCDGKVVVFSKEQCNFGYKQSIFQNQQLIIFEVTLRLKERKPLSIAKKMEKFKMQRLLHQPKGFSAGCVFKNKQNVVAGKLIQSANLAGFEYKNFRVSKKHCNFIINLGKGKARDLVKMIEKIKKKVYNETGIILEEEIIKVGEK